MFNKFQPILTQVKLTGFDEAAQLSTLFAVLVSIIVVLGTVVVILYKQQKRGISAHIKKLEEIRKEHTEKLDSIRIQDIERENERTKMWRESEKETLNVLNNVNTVIEMGDQMKGNDTKRILDKLKDIEGKIVK